MGRVKFEVLTVNKSSYPLTALWSISLDESGDLGLLYGKSIKCQLRRCPVTNVSVLMFLICVVDKDQLKKTRTTRSHV